MSIFKKHRLLTLGILILATGAAGAVMADTPLPTAENAPDTYVGTAKCKMCHMAQFRQFNAFATDTTQTARMNLRTGVTTDSKAVGHATADTEPDKLHVRGTLQCETCHGMGSRHFGLGAANRDTAARRATINLADGHNCRTCHSPHAVRN